MTFHAGPVPAGTSLYIPFTTYAGSTGASATCSGLAVTDVEIYKNGSTTQRASDAGIALLDTDGIDFDGITGLHGFSIDLSDNTDSGFFAVGSWYWVVVSAITVDSQTVTFLAATFRIAPAEGITGYPKTDQHAINADATAAANLAKSAAAIATCTASGTPTTTSIPTSACTPAGAVADQFKGRVIIFRDDTTTTALRGQATVITASSNAAAPTFTVVALTTAPASGDTFIIV